MQKRNRYPHEFVLVAMMLTAVSISAQEKPFTLEQVMSSPFPSGLVDDRNVPFAETIRLVEALRKQCVEFQQLIFPDELHDFLLHSSWLRAYHAAADFFASHLGGET